MKPGQIVLDQTTSGEHVVIRYPTMDDVDAMLAYINELSAEETYVGMQGEQFTHEFEEKHVEKVLADMEKKCALQLLFYMNAELKGICDMHGNKAGAVQHVGGLGISLHHSVRGRGYGTLLMRTLIEEIRKNLPHITILNLDRFGENEPGRKLYEKCGFVEYGRLPGGFIRKGLPHDCVAMYKKM